jgi:hypothetical protein
MRAFHVIAASILIAGPVLATSYGLSLEQKVARSEAILRVSVTSVSRAGCSARVLEVLKGPPDVKTVDFHFAPYPSGRFSADKLPGMVGLEYYVFLHQVDGWYWVLQGPAGIRPIEDHYQEHRVSSDGKITTETYSRSNFVAKIRSFVTQSDKKP